MVIKMKSYSEFLNESFNIFKKHDKIVPTNKAEEHLDFDYSHHNEHLKPFDEEHFHQHAPSINGNLQKKALDAYKHDSYNMNGSLWGGKNAVHNDDHHIEHVSALLKSTPAAKKDFHVYTGVKADSERLKGDLHIPAFTSASADHRIAGLFSSGKTVEKMKTESGNEKDVNVRHVIKIHVKKGQQVGGYVGDIGQRQHEREFLINKGHTLHFTGKIEDHVEQDSTFGGTPKIVRVHHATITPDDE